MLQKYSIISNGNDCDEDMYRSSLLMSLQL